MSGRRDAGNMSDSKIDNDVTGRFVTQKQNTHPTVKPVALMRWLVRLVTPPGGRVFDPFLGSGTTAVAAILEGFEWYGCEMTEDYWPIIKARVAWAEEQTALFQKMLDTALPGDAHIAAECLGFLDGYYPSGSKQVTGSRLDRIAERERTRVSRMIIDHLRSQTGQDLGANPNAWIEKHGTR